MDRKFAALSPRAFELAAMRYGLTEQEAGRIAAYLAGIAPEDGMMPNWTVAEVAAIRFLQKTRKRWMTGPDA